MKSYILGISDKAMPGVLNWKEKLETAKKAGYDFIEMVIDESNGSLKQLDMCSEERERLHHEILASGIGIKTISLHIHKDYPMGSSNGKICAKSMSILEKAICLAAQLGGADVQLAGYDVYYELSTEKTRMRFEENLEKASSFAAQYDIRLGIKPMETEFMNTICKALTYIKKINQNDIKIYPNIGTLTNTAKLYGMDVLKDIIAGQGVLLAMQLKDTLPGQYEDIPFGMGHVDFSRTMDMAWKLGVRKFAVDMNYRGNSNWRLDMAVAQGRMRKILGKMGEAHLA